MEYILLALAGLAGGFLAGLLGIGGGIVYILILPIVLTEAGIASAEIVQYTIANSLFGTFAASLSGTAALIRTRDFYWKETLLVAVASVVVALLSLELIVNTSFYSRKVFNVVIILILTYILIRTIRHASVPPAYDPHSPKRNPLLLLSGASGGLISSLSGLGGGAIIVPILNIGLKMDIRRAKSISLGMIVFASLAMTLFNSFEAPRFPAPVFSTGYLVWPVVLPMAFGVVLGAPFGVSVARKLSPKMISYLFALFILIVLGSKAYDLIEVI